MSVAWSDVFRSETYQAHARRVSTSQMMLSAGTVVALVFFWHSPIGFAGAAKGAIWALLGAGMLISIPASIGMFAVDFARRRRAEARGITPGNFSIGSSLIHIGASLATIFSTMWAAGAFS